MAVTDIAGFQLKDVGRPCAGVAGYPARRGGEAHVKAQKFIPVRIAGK